MTQQNPDEARLSTEEAASLTSRFGAGWKVWELNGRRWCLRKPRRPEWQAFKCDSGSPDPTTRADASVALARAILVPIDPGGTVEAERTAFDAMGEEYPALLDILGAAAEAAGAGPLVLREVKPPASSQPPAATPTSPPTG